MNGKLQMYDVDVFWDKHPDVKSGFSLIAYSEKEAIEEALQMTGLFPMSNGTHMELPPPDRAEIVTAN